MKSGDILGPYRILSKLGEGGMGEVYRATDTNLKREVAIKVLPETLAADPERLARFQREAEVLAALNHPNIAHIHGLERSGGTTALVMELVEGSTLADRIAAGPIPIDEALPIAKQIAEALEAAHEQGIVHRDLKPANVKVRPDGTVKVLDFGLAKAIEPAGPAPASASMSPTITTPAMTQAGMILGTAAYMSPEQAKGRPADKRSDIWAFGCVLFEMLTGRRAFGGEDVSETLADVMRVEPTWQSLPDGVSPSLVTFLKRCLNKDSRRRLGDIHDMRLALEGAFETAAPEIAVPAPAPRSRVRLGVGAAGLLVVGLVVGAAGWSWGTRASAPPPTERVSLMAPATEPVIFNWSPGRSLALSPDGTELVYVTRKAGLPTNQPATLVLRSLATRTVRDLPGTAGAHQPFFSPDGQWVAFFTVGTGALKKIALAGGNPITVADKINGSVWAFGVWLDDGTIVFCTPGTSGSVLRRVSADGGPVTNLTTLDTAQGEVGHGFPALVPSTQAVLFTTALKPLKPDSARIEALRLDTGERHVVVDNAWDPLVLNGEYLLFQRQDTTVIAPFDVRRLTLTGPAVPFTESVRADDALRRYPVAELAASQSGTLAYVPAEGETAGTLGLVSRDGTFQPLGVPPGPIAYPRVAPDGHTVAFVEGRRTTSDVRIYDLTRGSTITRGQEDAVFGPAVWQPGTGALAVDGRKGDISGVFLDGPDGADRLLVPSPKGSSTRNITWSPDGKQLAYTVQAGALHDIWILTPGGNPTTRPLLHGPAREYSPAFSPDGRWLAYVSDESGRSEVYVQRYPEGPRLPVSIDGGENPVWRRDGKELFFADRGVQKMMAVSVMPEGTSLRLGKPVALFDLQVTGPAGTSEAYVAGTNAGVGYDVLPDGRFVMVRQPNQTTTREIVLVRNWLDEVKRLVATQ